MWYICKRDSCVWEVDIWIESKEYGGRVQDGWRNKNKI